MMDEADDAFAADTGRRVTAMRLRDQHAIEIDNLPVGHVGDPLISIPLSNATRLGPLDHSELHSVEQVWVAALHADLMLDQEVDRLFPAHQADRLAVG